MLHARRRIRATQSQATTGALVEADISRFKRVIGDGLRSRTDRRRETEIALAVSVLNRMLELGRPEYVRLVGVTADADRRSTFVANSVQHSRPRGQRVRDKAPHGHWKTLTFLAALRHDRIDAPCVLDGPVNGRLFQAYVEQILVPTLAPGDVVILDNLGSHKGKAVRRAIREAGAHLLFLPPYSPDLNPIEQVFAKLKTLLRKARKRSVEATWRCIGLLLDQFSQTECANYLRNSGYTAGST